jgi:hypothetical protein
MGTLPPPPPRWPQKPAMTKRWRRMCITPHHGPLRR